MTLSPATRGCPKGIRLVGTGVGMPSRVVTNDDLAKLVDTTHEWIEQRSGIRARRLVDETQSLRSLAGDALRQALAEAKLDPGELDMLILATMTPEMICPSTAARVVSEVGAAKAGAVDISAACSGFVYGLNMAASMLHAGFHRHVAVIGAEVMSRSLDWEDRRTCVLFGDGAGAAVLSACDDTSKGCLYQTLGSDGSKWGELYMARHAGQIPPGDTIFSGKYDTLQMNGREVYKFAVSTLGACIDEALAAAELKASDLASIIVHQSNARIIEGARKRLGLPEEAMYVNIDRYGNTSGASVPLCLHELRQAGRVKEGDLVLFVALGGGLTWASSLWKL